MDLGLRGEGDIMVRAAAAWATAIAAWAIWLRAGGRPESSIYLRTYQVGRFAADHGSVRPWKVDLEQLAHWLGCHDWSPETRRSYRAALRGFYDWAQITGRVTANPAALLPSVAVPPGVPRPAPEIVYQRALARADERVALMLRLARQAGLRRAEIASVRGEDVEADLVGWSLRVTGKGGRVRRVPLLDDLAAQIRACGGYAFPGQIDGHLSPRHVGKLIARALGNGWTAHPLRHSFATRAYAAQRDLRAVQELLGHSKPETTARYTQVPNDALRAAVIAAA